MFPHAKRRAACRSHRRARARTTPGRRKEGEGHFRSLHCDCAVPQKAAPSSGRRWCGGDDFIAAVGRLVARGGGGVAGPRSCVPCSRSVRLLAVGRRIHPGLFLDARWRGSGKVGEGGSPHYARAGVCQQFFLSFLLALFSTRGCSDRPACLLADTVAECLFDCAPLWGCRLAPLGRPLWGRFGPSRGSVESVKRTVAVARVRLAARDGSSPFRFAGRPTRLLLVSFRFFIMPRASCLRLTVVLFRVRVTRCVGPSVCVCRSRRASPYAACRFHSRSSSLSPGWAACQMPVGLARALLPLHGQ